MLDGFDSEIRLRKRGCEPPGEGANALHGLRVWINGVDFVPASSTYVAGSMLSGSTCAGATTAEDDNSSGADESNPMGGSVSGSTLTVTAPSLNTGSSIALVYNATVN